MAQEAHSQPLEQSQPCLQEKLQIAQTLENSDSTESEAVSPLAAVSGWREFTPNAIEES